LKRLPIYLPARLVERLREAADAAGLDGGAEEFLTDILGDFVATFGNGDFDLINPRTHDVMNERGYECEGLQWQDAEDALKAMAACWQAEDEAADEMEGAA
jgi:thiamine pyrophosphokinase